jgi:hypothetical protein
MYFYRTDLVSRTKHQAGGQAHNNMRYVTAGWGLLIYVCMYLYSRQTVRRRWILVYGFGGGLRMN